MQSIRLVGEFDWYKNNIHKMNDFDAKKALNEIKKIERLLSKKLNLKEVI